MNCLHQNFQSDVEVVRLLDGASDERPALFMAEITITCADCQQPFHFRGLEFGLSFNRPTIEVLGTKLLVPIREGQLNVVPEKLVYEMQEDDLIKTSDETFH